eukprot:9489513-Pyramimonas_sp.AAC.1
MGDVPARPRSAWQVGWQAAGGARGHGERDFRRQAPIGERGVARAPRRGAPGRASGFRPQRPLRGGRGPLGRGRQAGRAGRRQPAEGAPGRCVAAQTLQPRPAPALGHACAPSGSL